MWVGLQHAPNRTTLHTKVLSNGLFDPLTNMHSTPVSQRQFFAGISLINASQDSRETKT